MYKCPNCAGNLKFDIARQKLHCEYWDTQMDPYGFYQEKDAEEGKGASGEYKVTVFTCPQCGSELISEDTTAATFCSFCGATAILDSRISRERQPECIIPFTKTKEDCRAAYGKLLRWAIFAPKELKDETLIEKFRGIYMPYWVYSFEKKEHISFLGKKTHRKGDYLLTDHYQLDCDVEEDYKGLAYDASSAFSDSLSNAIAPFDLRQEKSFTPSFLSGFYADTSDVDKFVYMSDAEKFVIQDACERLLREPVCGKCGVGRPGDEYIIENALRPDKKTARLAMLPVWFLSYRNKDRVSYAVVNGQTGKAAADLPVDGKKYLAGSFLLAVPLFFLLNLSFTITPGALLLIAAVLAFLCVLISNGQMNHILARESGEDDKGLASTREFRARNTQWKWNRKKKNPGLWNNGIGRILLAVLGVYLMSWLFVGFARLADVLAGIGMIGSSSTMFYFIILLIILSNFVKGRSSRRRGRSSDKKSLGGGHFKEKRLVLVKPLGGIALAVIILLVNPVSDWFYYIGAFVCMGMVLWAIMDIIRQHNLLTTRKLPQLNRRGGDEHA